MSSVRAADDEPSVEACDPSEVAWRIAQELEDSWDGIEVEAEPDDEWVTVTLTDAAGNQRLFSVEVHEITDQVRQI